MAAKLPSHQEVRSPPLLVVGQQVAVSGQAAAARAVGRATSANDLFLLHFNQATDYEQLTDRAADDSFQQIDVFVNVPPSTWKLPSPKGRLDALILSHGVLLSHRHVVVTIDLSFFESR